MKITFFSALFIFIILLLIRIILKCKKPISKTFYGIISGIAVLIISHIIGIYIDVEIPISIMSVGISSVAGIPGVIMILFLNMITK